MPEHAAEFESNCFDLSKDLNKLHQQYKIAL